MYAKKDDRFPVDRRELLRVKIKSLAAEAAIIRREEVRTWGPLYVELRKHRVGVLRGEARAAHIAYGLVRGRDYVRIEADAHSAPEWETVHRLAQRYGRYGFDYAPVVKAAAERLTARLLARRAPLLRAVKAPISTDLRAKLYAEVPAKDEGAAAAALGLSIPQEGGSTPPALAAEL